MAAALDFVQMFAQPFENGGTLTFGNFPLDFRQREVNDVVMVNFLARQRIAQLQPHSGAADQFPSA